MSHYTKDGVIPSRTDSRVSLGYVLLGWSQCESHAQPKVITCKKVGKRSGDEVM